MKEEKAVINASKEELAKLHKELTPADYVRHIQNVNTEYLWTYLTEYMRYLNNSVQETTNDVSKIESAIQVVQKGFRYYSEKNNALRYYLYGYFSNQQEELLQKLYIIYNHERIERVLNKKHLREVVSFLYSNQIVQQKDLVNHLKVSKTNIDRKLMPLIECGLVEKIKAGAAFYKLTARGYEYYRQKRNEPSKPCIVIRFEAECKSDDEFYKLQNFEKENLDPGDVSTKSRREIYQEELSINTKQRLTKPIDCDRYYFSTRREFLKI